MTDMRGVRDIPCAFVQILSASLLALLTVAGNRSVQASKQLSSVAV